MIVYFPNLARSSAVFDDIGRAEVAAFHLT
jgi:hypothetical protein